MNDLMRYGTGNFYNNQFSEQIRHSNTNNVFSQFGHKRNMNGFYMNNDNQNLFTYDYNNQNEEDNDSEGNENNNNNNIKEVKKEIIKKMQIKLIKLRNSVIGQLQRFKYKDYKGINSKKEIHQ